MLDQNTDRMWYVIGAVIVGAALIFLMNHTMPTLFGSVGTTFETKTGDVIELVDTIGVADNVPDEETDAGVPVVPNPNLVLQSGDYSKLFTYLGAGHTYQTGISVPEWNTTKAARFKTTGGTSHIKMVRSVDSSQWKGKQATLSVYVKNLGDSPITVYSNGVSSVMRTVQPGETTRVVVTGTVRTDYDFVQFRYDASHADEDLDIVLYGHKIELGDKATPYVE